MRRARALYLVAELLCCQIHGFWAPRGSKGQKLRDLAVFEPTSHPAENERQKCQVLVARRHLDPHHGPCVRRVERIREIRNADQAFHALEGVALLQVYHHLADPQEWRSVIVDLGSKQQSDYVLHVLRALLFVFVGEHLLKFWTQSRS